MSETALAPTLTAKQMASVIADPMLAAPEAVRPMLWQVWVCNQHLFPSALPLSGCIGRWIRRNGLTESDALAILERTMTPESISQFRFASDLLTFLAESAKEAISRRKTIREMKERREERPGVSIEALRSAQISEAFKMPKE